MPIDIKSGYKEVKDKINAYKTYKEVSDSVRDIKNKQSDFISNQRDNITSTLDNIKKFQDKTFRNAPTSFDEFFSLIGVTRGNGGETVSYIKKKLIETAIKIEPEIKEIIKKEIFKSLGCSQQQTYLGVSKESLLSSPTSNQLNGILIPVKSIDIFGSLKNKPDDILGKLFYEKETPSTDDIFKPYGGETPFPFNKELRFRIENESKSYLEEYGDLYNGKSGQPLLDFSYVKQNNEDYISVTLINRNGENKIADFLFDYFETIKLYDSSDFLNQILNALLSTFDIKLALGYGDLRTKSKFLKIVQRILGLCFDNRQEIDISGTAKVSEIDNFDDSIFELTEIDLRQIDDAISNIQNGIIQYEDCNNVKLPINTDSILNEILGFKESYSSSSIEEQVNEIDKILDNITYNEEWARLFPDTLNLKLNFDTDLIKKIPSTIVSAVLSPKVLLPAFVLLKTIESQANETKGAILNDSNQLIKNFDEANAEINNYVNDSMDFLFKFKNFSIQVVSQIGALFLRTLFDILKKDIINLIKPIISDIAKNQLTKKYIIILKLANILVLIANIILDYRKCRSLVEDILKTLNLVTSLVNRGLGATDPIPAALLPLTQFLPGYSPQRATINIIEEMQRLGLPTGPLPDGSPNLMLQFTLASQIGSDREEAENGKVVGVIDPSVPIIIRAKKI